MMKNTLRKVLILSAVAVLLSACSNPRKMIPSSSVTEIKSEQASSSSSDRTEISDSSLDTSLQVESINYSLYDEVIVNYGQVSTATNILDLDINIIAMQAEQYDYVYSGIEYSYYDLDKNGIAELLVAFKLKKSNGYILLDIRTIKDGQVIRLTTENGMDMMGERQLLMPLKDGTLVFTGASSASDRRYYQYKFNNDGTRLEEIKELQSSEEIDNLPEYLDLNNLQWFPVTKEKLPIENNTLSNQWNQNKAQKLNDYILNVWGPTMGQSYQEYSLDTNLNWFGMQIPDRILNYEATESSGLTPDFNGIVPDIIWWQENKILSDQMVLVAVYSDVESTRSMGSHLYLFTITNGLPQVWITQQNQGNEERKFYFTETKNQELKNFFVNLVNNA